MLRLGHLCTAFVPLLSIFRTTSAKVLVYAPEQAPSNASQYVDHAFGSFSMAVHVFPDYAGNDTTPNIFSRNLIEILGNKTGKAPYIRVGGTSADHTNYIANQTQSIVIEEEGPNGIPEVLTIGTTFFEGFHNFPGSRFHFDLNLVQNNSNGLPNALAEARVALKYIGANLESFEIGNEPDLYAAQGLRPSNYTENDYVIEWTKHAQAVTQQVLASNEYGLNPWTNYQALTYSGANQNFSLIPTFNNSHINADQIVKSTSLHYYPNGYSSDLRLQSDFMNHTSIADGLSQFIKPMAYLKETNPNVTFVLGETNSDYINLGIPEFTGVFGNALWVCDYLLYGMSLNIARVYLHQGTSFGYAAWMPVSLNGTAPHVRAPYYGNLLVADVVGSSPTMQILNVDLDDWSLSAYASFEAGLLAKYVVINLDEWNSTTNYSRPVQQVSLQVPADVTGARVDFLSAPGAEATDGITWAGMSYGFQSLGLGVQTANDTQNLVAVNGTVSVSVESTQAIMVTLMRSNATIIPTTSAAANLGSLGRLMGCTLLMAAGIVLIT